MKKKCFILCLSFLLVVVNLFSIAVAEASQKFYQDNLSSAKFKSPNRNASNVSTDVWPHINSAWNQPRSVGTNPHNGSDLRMTIGTSVYPAFSGTVSAKGTDWIQIKHSNGYYMVYKHVNPDNALTVGSTVGINTPIATIQNITAPHLHFGLNSNTSTNYNNLIWASNSGPYSHVSISSGNWYSGRGLDFIKSHSVSGGTITVYAYASDDANANIIPTKVLLYHRKNGASAWSSAVNMTRSQIGNEYRYQSNFAALGYRNNDRVDFLIVAYRSGMTNNNWAFYPAYYATPAETPNSSSKFYSTFLSGLPEPQLEIELEVEVEN